MSRTMRIMVFGGVVLAAWCFSSDQLLSRVASDEVLEEGAASAQGEQNESDYQVVKLLSKLFTSIKRNHVEVLNLHRQYARTTDNAERADLRRQMQERIAFVDGKAKEYQALVPSLQQSYPGLKSVIASFTRDLKGISGDLDLICQTDQIGGGEAERTASTGRRKGSFLARKENQESAPIEEPKPDSSSSMAAAAIAAVESPQDQAPAPQMEMASDGGPIVPITLEVRSDKGEKVDKRKIVFQVADNKKAGMRGFLADGNLVKEAIAFTDSAGRAVVRLQLEAADGPLKIKRTIFPRDDHTVCLLESVAK